MGDREDSGKKGEAPGDREQVGCTGVEVTAMRHVAERERLITIDKVAHQTPSLLLKKP